MRKKTLFVGSLLILCMMMALSLGRYSLSFKEVLDVIMETFFRSPHYNI